LRWLQRLGERVRGSLAGGLGGSRADYCCCCAPGREGHAHLGAHAGRQVAGRQVELLAQHLPVRGGPGPAGGGSWSQWARLDTGQALRGTRQRNAPQQTRALARTFCCLPLSSPSLKLFFSAPLLVRVRVALQVPPGAKSRSSSVAGLATKGALGSAGASACSRGGAAGCVSDQPSRHQAHSQAPDPPHCALRCAASTGSRAHLLRLGSGLLASASASCSASESAAASGVLTRLSWRGTRMGDFKPPAGARCGCSALACGVTCGRQAG
jgi:hypothetical protein